MLFLETGKIRVDNETMFRLQRRDGKSMLPEGMPDGESDLALRGLYFEQGNRKIVIDPGPGRWIPTFFPGYHFSRLHNACEILKKQGIDPSGITDIFLTHLHFDHCAGIFIMEKEKLHPAFPGTTIHISRLQYAQLADPSPGEKDSFLPGFAELTEKYYTISLCDPAVIPDFVHDVFFTDGHTPGMMVPLFIHDDMEYAYVSDLIPATVNLPVDVISGYDTDPGQLIKEKNAFYHRFAGRELRVIFFHEPDKRKQVLEKVFG